MYKWIVNLHSSVQRTNIMYRNRIYVKFMAFIVEGLYSILYVYYVNSWNGGNKIENFFL